MEVYWATGIDTREALGAPLDLGLPDDVLVDQARAVVIGRGVAT